MMDLFLTREAEQLGTLISAWSLSGPDRVIEALSDHFAILSHNSLVPVLSIELQLHAMRDGAFAARYDATRSAYLEKLASIIEAMLEASFSR